MASMRNWLKETDKDDEDKKGERVVVVHCKAGKGRSGTSACSYLIAEEGWKVEDALQRFTERRMRPGFGPGISIPSQLRWIRYVDRWAKNGKLYMERQIEITELHVWGIRDGVKISVEGFVDEGKTIKTFHVFQKDERQIIKGSIKTDTSLGDVVVEVMNRPNTAKKPKRNKTLSDPNNENTESQESSKSSKGSAKSEEDEGADVIFRPSSRVVLPSNDINIDIERRNKAAAGWTMVTSVAHVWFNTFFEGSGPEKQGNSDDSGVFEIDWEAIDGIKGSARKGTKSFDKLSVIWRAIDSQDRKTSNVIEEPKEGEEVPQAAPADWRGQEASVPDEDKDLGLRVASPISASVSRAGSVKGTVTKPHKEEVDELIGVRSDMNKDEISSEAHKKKGPLPLSSDLPAPGDMQAVSQAEQLDKHSNHNASNVAAAQGHHSGSLEPESSPVRGVIKGVQHVSTEDLPDGKPQEDLETSPEHMLGHLKKKKDTSTSS